MTDDIRRIPGNELDEQCTEAWERVTDEPGIRGVSACRVTLGERPYWSVAVVVAEFLRDDPLEADLRRRRPAAFLAVEGAARVWEEDREAWGVSGTPSGQALVRAAARVVDRLAARTRDRVEALQLRWPEF